MRSRCVEEDCRPNQSIKVVNPTTGECVTCFPCLVCTEGISTPSVPCGSTVPLGTDIHCIQIQPVSTYTTKYVTFRHLATSPSVTTWSSSITGTTQITTVPIMSGTHLVVVPATSSTYASSSSSDNANSKKAQQPRKKKEFPSEEDHKMGDYTIIYIAGCIALVITFVAILCRWQKRKTCRFYPIPISSNTTCNDPYPVMSTTWSSNKACTVHPETNSALFSSSCCKDDELGSKKGNDQHFQTDQVQVADAFDEFAVTTVPSSLDDNPTEGSYLYSPTEGC